MVTVTLVELDAPSSSVAVAKIVQEPAARESAVVYGGVTKVAAVTELVLITTLEIVPSESPAVASTVISAGEIKVAPDAGCEM
jgi:hypothetical protein